MKYLNRIKNYLLAKFTKLQLGFILVLIIFAFFVSDSNLFARFGYDSDIRDLKRQIKFYREQAETDQKKLEELDSNKSNIEKFGRENYLMKKSDEDIFIVNDAEENEKE